LRIVLREAPLLEAEDVDARVCEDVDGWVSCAVALRGDAVGREAELVLRADAAEGPAERRPDRDDARVRLGVGPGADPATVLPSAFESADLLVADLTAGREERLLLVLCVATGGSFGCLR
jgi:hypothetical protein